MARDRRRVRVHSFVDNRVLRHVSVADGNALCDSGEARRLNRRKEPLTDIRLNFPERLQEGSRATITRSEVQANAEGSADPWRRIKEGNRINRETGKMEHVEANYIDDAMSKIEAWPEIYDEKAVCVCAGAVHQPGIPA